MNFFSSPVCFCTISPIICTYSNISYTYGGRLHNGLSAFLVAFLHYYGADHALLIGLIWPSISRYETPYPHVPSKHTIIGRTFDLLLNLLFLVSNPCKNANFTTKQFHVFNRVTVRSRKVQD